MEFFSLKYVGLTDYSPKGIIQWAIFNSKWLLLPFLMKLICSLVMLGWEYCFHSDVSAEEVMHILHGVDIVMIAYLVRMIVIGLYNSAIDKSHKELGEKISSGLLKIKLSTSIMGVSSIHLLQSFMQLHEMTDKNWFIISVRIGLQVLIHLVFIYGSHILAKMEYLHDLGESIHKEEHDEHEQTETHDH